MTILFWISAGLVFYTYFGFFLLVWFLSKVAGKPHVVGEIRPKVSLVIAAYNEEKVIGDKLRNTLALSYPRELLEIIVVADGSTDSTVAIAEEFAESDIKVMHTPGRKGKTAAINRAAEECTGDVLFFSDANTEYSEDVIEKLVRNFADPKVGGVSGRKVILDREARAATEGEAVFWSYESFLKTCESRLGSIATADGEIFAVRRSLFQPFPAGVVHDDMYLTLQLVQQGFRVVYDNDATSAEQASKNLWDEFHLKVRYASAGYQIIAMFRPMLIPPRSFFAFEFLSHKFLRWTAPVFLVGVFIASAFAPGAFYGWFFWLQVAFYGAALLGLAVPGSKRVGLIYFPSYFLMGNAAALYGIVKYVFVGQSTQWRTAER